MQKNKNKKIKTGLLIFASLAFGWALSAGSASAAPGLSIDVQIQPPVTRFVSDSSNGEWHGESVYKTTGNVNFYTTANNLIVNFPKIKKDSDEVYRTTLKAKGAINLPTSGNYRFDYDYNGGYGAIYVENACYPPNTAAGEPASLNCYYSHYFTAGWHDISFSSDLATYNYLDPQLRLTWMTPGSSAFVVIPTASLDSSNWDDTEILIPSSDKTQIDYKIAGVGTDDSDISGGVKELEIRLPDGITAGDILPGGTQLFWRNSESTTLRVRNAATTNAAINLTGLRLKTAKGATLEGITAKLPDSFFNNSKSNQNIYLSFENLDADIDGGGYPDIDGGIALVVVYKDLTKPNGVLKIKTLGENVHGAASHPVSFDVSSMDPTTLRPFFLFADAQSKTLLSEGGLPRHNYLAMKASSSQTGESELFMQGITTAAGEISNPALKRIIPRVNGEPTLASVDQWYPMFGREGPEADVLSTAQNYAPNLRYGGYVSGNSEGVFDTAATPFQIPSGNNWVSFQYAASDFYGDGDAPLYSNESSFFFATGLLYYDEAKLLVCPASASLALGETKSLEARYWATYFGMPDCNTTGWTNVTTSANWSSSEPLTVSLPAKGSIKGEKATTVPVTISAVYNSITAAIEATVSDTSCVSYSCVSSACVAVPGTSPCPPNSGGCTSSGGACTSVNNTNVRWEEVAP